MKKDEILKPGSSRIFLGLGISIQRARTSLMRKRRGELELARMRFWLFLEGLLA